MNSYTTFMVIPASDHEALDRLNKCDECCRVRGCSSCGPCRHHDIADAGHVSLAQAEQVLGAIAAKYGIEDTRANDLFLTSWEHEELEPGSWGIAWEGGPEDWAFTVAGGDGNGVSVPGVHIEVYANWLITVHPA